MAVDVEQNSTVLSNPLSAGDQNCPPADPPTAPTSAATAPVRRRRSKGGQMLNRNATKHGLRMALSRLPLGASFIRRQIDVFRRELEAAVVAVHGSITITRAALVQSACRHETRAALIARWLAREPDLDLDKRLTLLRDLSAATSSRDATLAKLQLDVDSTESLARMLYGPRPGSPYPAVHDVYKPASRDAVAENAQGAADAENTAERHPGDEGAAQ